MRGNKTNEVLSAFRPFHQLLFIRSSSQFYGKDHQTKTYRLLRSFCFLFLLLSLIMSILLGFWYCIHSEENLKEIVLPLSMTICSVQIFSIYVAIAMKKSTICAAIKTLQQIVDERKPICLLQLASIHLSWYKSLVNIFSTEKRKSPESLAVYGGVEKMHTLITNLVFKVPLIWCNLDYFLTALIPLCSAIFGFPQPNQWILLLGYQ